MDRKVYILIFELPGLFDVGEKKRNHEEKKVPACRTNVRINEIEDADRKKKVLGQNRKL